MPLKDITPITLDDQLPNLRVTHQNDLSTYFMAPDINPTMYRFYYPTNNKILMYMSRRAGEKTNYLFKCIQSAYVTPEERL